MRRIYESQALPRDDEDPHSPSELDSAERPQAMRSINATALSRRLIPNWLGYRAVSVDVSVPRPEFPVGSSVPFSVTMKNAMPFPIVITTRSPVVWTWAVDGVTEASHVPLRDPPGETYRFRFDRSERKRFRKRWNQMFRVSEAEWEPVGPGEYTIGACLNVARAERRGLSGETTVRLVRE